MFSVSVLIFAASLQGAPSSVPSSEGELALTIFEAVRTAVANDLSLRIEEVSGDVALYTFEGSWGAYDPVLRANVGYRDSETAINQPYIPVPSIKSKSWSASTGLSYPVTTGGAFDLSLLQTTTDTTFATLNPSIADTLALSFSQPLLRGAGSKYGTSWQRENELLYKRQLERIRQARQDLMKAVADAYWDLVASREQLKVADEALALGREQLDQNTRRLDAGVGTEVEVLQADTNIAQRVEQKLARELIVRAAGDRLKGLMYPGKDPATWELEIAPITDLPEVVPAEVPDWRSAMATALEQRAELRQQLLQIDAGEEQLVRAKSERQAALDFVVAAQNDSLQGSESHAFRSVLEWEYPTYTASLQLSLPIGNRSALNAEKSARAALRSARLVYDQIESQIVEEVRAAVRNTNYSLEAVRAAAASMELARRQLAAEQARYREGLSTNFQVLEFQQQLSDSQYSYTLARTNLAKAYTALMRAQGTIGDAQP